MNYQENDSRFVPEQQYYQQHAAYAAPPPPPVAVEKYEQELITEVLIIVGVMAALFKIPTVEFNGPAKHPDGLAAFDKSNDTLAFNVNFGLKIGVVNYNLESVTFESIRTIATPNVPVGGGIIHNVNIKSYGTSNFTFPFSIQYNPSKDEGYRMLTDIATKCGLLGGTSKEDLVIDYDLIPTVRIASFVIAPIIRQSSRFPCPVSAGQLTSGIQNL
ncbi:hypothetical protein BD770DRAFT_473901 [Pilaira anomala]|nr:hypothetical protein BD770DRAFT_473901 [Pilaira anomala]